MSLKKKKYRAYEWNKWEDFRLLRKYVVLDIETTGLSPDKEQIIEIAISKVMDGIVVDELSSLVSPGKKLPPRVVKLTGLTDDDLATAPPFSKIAQQIVDFIGQDVILAHNAPFDLSFVTSALDRCNIDVDFQYIDTVQIARKAFPFLANHKLDTLVKELGIAREQTHRAMDDVHHTLAFFRIVYNQYTSPLAVAVSSYCSPIERYHFSYKEKPLKGLSFALVGTFTSSYSALKKLISAAGGTVANGVSHEVDYLIYGFIDPINSPPTYQQLLDKVRQEWNTGNGTYPINEIAFLKLCGVTFFDEEDNYE